MMNPRIPTWAQGTPRLAFQRCGVSEKTKREQPGPLGTGPKVCYQIALVHTELQRLTDSVILSTILFIYPIAENHHWFPYRQVIC